MEIPDVIYLQAFWEDGEPCSIGDMTWCIDKIHETDIEYVRKADELKRQTGLRDEDGD